VTSSSSSDKWVVPGGGLEPCETSRDAAIREVMEEAGVKGDILRHCGTFEVRFIECLFDISDSIDERASSSLYHIHNLETVVFPSIHLF